jgi:hypothetical protein
MIGRTLVGRAAIRAVEEAMEVVGGASRAPGSIRCRRNRNNATPAETR